VGVGTIEINFGAYHLWKIKNDPTVTNAKPVA
jgi:hypothetical protein